MIVLFCLNTKEDFWADPDGYVLTIPLSAGPLAQLNGLHVSFAILLRLLLLAGKLHEVLLLSSIVQELGLKRG